jgi:hypothetical protein
MCARSTCNAPEIAGQSGSPDQGRKRPIGGRPADFRAAAGSGAGLPRSRQPLPFRAFAAEVRFALDSPLEGSGFELPVPREKRGPVAPAIITLARLLEELGGEFGIGL